VQRVQLITDSGCDVLGGGFGGIDVRVIPFPYSLDGSERVDDPQYTPALDTFYEAIRRGARVTTSQVRVADCAQVFRNCANLNTPAVYITLSSGLSGTFEAALRARANSSSRSVQAQRSTSLTRCLPRPDKRFLSQR